MTAFCLSSSATMRNIIVTTLFCLCVAALTYTVWDGQIYIHLLISLGYGFSAIFSSITLTQMFPKISSQQETILSLIFSVILGSLNAWFWLENYPGDSLAKLLPVVLLGIIFSAMCFYYFYNREQKAVAERLLEEAKRKQAEQEKTLILSQLMQMQSQIEPHFLFNTLANISALMTQDVDKARMMLEKLTELLRTTLANSRLSQTTVDDEIRQLSAYLAIQKIRLDERLKFDISVEDKLTYAPIPPMLIQPLVENAIKHGIEPKKAGGTIHISLSEHQEKLKIQVKDNGVGLSDSAVTKGHGVALNNIKQRVRGLYAQQGHVDITQPENGGFCVTISIPIGKDSHAL